MEVPPAPVTPQSECIELQVSPELELLLQQAAKLEGFRSVSEYVLSIVEPAARGVVNSHSELCLDEVDSTVFVQALLHPCTPNIRLMRALQYWGRHIYRT